ncbi:alpha/beta-hydrolase [Hymenopellis radicata]|nr:alpha/beta-hydrolase [Hymenopellis radicata]
MTRDAIAVMDHLNISKVAVVGWSDGAITGLDMAMNYTNRVDRVFAHGANAQYNQSIPQYGTFKQLAGSDIVARDEDPYSYANLSPTPDKEEEMNEAVVYMWETEPAWGADAFALIEAPVWIVDGDRDSSITRNQPDAMASWTPFAGQLILPQVGHDVMAEDPILFNFAMRYFLEMEYDGQLPVY